MKSLLVLAVAGAVVMTGCDKHDHNHEGHNHAGHNHGTETKPADGTMKTPTPTNDMGRRRKIVAPEKKGLIATYLCECQEKEWTQPAEEEKLCLDYCGGKMPECGKLVKEEAAPK